jgi:hypothetical protein
VGILAWICFKKSFSDGKIFVTFLIQNLEMFISVWSYMEIRASEGGLPWGLPKFDQNSKTWFLKKAILLVKWRYWRDFPSMFCKKIETLCIDVIRTLLRGASSKSHAVSDFEVFFLTYCRVLPVWVEESWSAEKFGHARRLGHFTCEITLNDAYLSQFLPDRKVLLMTLEQLFEILIKLTIFDSSRAICILI